MESKIVTEIGIIESSINGKFIYIEPYKRYLKFARIKLDDFSNKNKLEFEIYFNHSELSFSFFNSENNPTSSNSIDNFIEKLNAEITEKSRDASLL